MGGGGRETATKHKELEKGASLLCMKYKDKKDIYLISTVHKGKIVETAKVNRKKNIQTNKRERKKKSAVVHAYNATMNAVDQFDQNIARYNFNRKTVKWWKRALTRLLHVAKVQCMILYNKTHEDEQLTTV